MALKTQPPYVLMACFWNAELAGTDVVRYFEPIDALTLTSAEVSLKPGQRAKPLTVLILHLATAGIRKTERIELRQWHPDGRDTFDLAGQVSPIESPPARLVCTAPIAFRNPLAGFHWLDVVYGDRVLTRVPLEVIIQDDDRPVH